MRLNVGDKLKLDIRKQGINGEGIGYYQKIAVFVPNAIIKEVVDVEIVESFERYAIGKILEIERVSNRRVQPPCKFYDLCGGCQMQHIAYKEQLKIKQSIIKQALRRYTKLNTEKLLINKTISMEEPYYYRNRSQMVFKNTNFGLSLGFYQPNSNHFVYVDSCIVHHKKLDEINFYVLKLMRKYKQKAYDFNNKEGILEYLSVRYLASSDSASVVFVVKRNTPILEKITKELMNDLEVVKSVSYSIDNEKSNLIIANPPVVIGGVDKIEETYRDILFKVSPDAFHQLNTKQMEKMYDLVLDSKQFSPSDIVFDLYSGIGITSLLIAGKVKGVYGIDYSEASVADAKENARINNVKNIQFITDHVEGALPKLFKQNIKPDVIVLDPPRSGMSNAVIEAVKKVLPKKIIYMSCNPSTLAKNISELIDNYRIISINPIDMFPQSASVESVTFLELKQEGR